MEIQGNRGQIAQFLIGGLGMAKKAAKSEPKTKAAKTSAKPEAKSKAAPKTEKKAPIKAATKPKPAAKLKEQAVAEVSAPVEAAVLETKAVVEKPKKEKKPSAKALKAAALQTAAAHESNKKWNELKEKFGQDKAITYSMSAVFEANTPIQHKSFGWGYIIANENNRLEVLFESGPRHLISNYKP